jgi:hypothetical protein
LEQSGLTSDWHLLPVTKLILRVGALSTEKDDIPRNAYNPAKPILPEAILDKKSYLAGRFLITKYACHQQMFGLTSIISPSSKEACH